MRGVSLICAVALVAALCFAGVANACPGGQCAQNFVAPQAYVAPANVVAQYYVAPVVAAQIAPQYVQFEQVRFKQNQHHAAAQQRANAQAQRADRRANRANRGRPANVVVNNY